MRNRVLAFVLTSGILLTPLTLLRAAETETGPPAPEANGPTALILPSMASAAATADSATLDVLVATALSDAGYDIPNLKDALETLHTGPDTLPFARDLYLSVKLEEALTAVEQTAQEHLSHHGDLLADPQLREAQLFQLKILNDLNRDEQAIDLSISILMRHPTLTLDPALYTPALQALWLRAVEKQALMQPTEPDPKLLGELAQTVGADLVVMGIRKQGADGADWLVILLGTRDGAAKRIPIKLGDRPVWASQVRVGILGELAPKMLLPPPPPPNTTRYPVEGDPQADPDKPWYRRWWLWTIVGVVVVGGTVGGIVGYRNSREEIPPVETDPLGTPGLIPISSFP